MTSDCVGGVWTYSLELASELERRGHEVVLATMGGSLSDAQQSDLAAAGLFASDGRDHRLEWMDDPWEDVRAAGQWLLELASLYSVDLAHLNVFSPAALSWPCPVVVVAHSDVATWWRAVKGKDAPADWDRYRDHVAAGLAAADSVVAPTQAMADSLNAAFAVPRVDVIHNGRSWPETSHPTKEPLLVSVGRVWDEAKNIRVAAEAAQALPWPLKVAGEGEVAGAASLGRLPPAEVAALLQRASIFVEPARYEPFGLAALEAAQAGCALVLGDIASLREVWADAAIYVPPEDVEKLRSVLVRLIHDPAELGERQAAARARARLYPASAMADGYETLYGRLAVRAAQQVGGGG